METTSFKMSENDLNQMTHVKDKARVSSNPLITPEDDGVPAWFIAGICVLAFAMSAAVIAVVCFYARCRKRKSLANDTDTKVESIVFQSNRSSAQSSCAETETSSDSTDLPDLPKVENLYMMRPSLSIDVGAPFVCRKQIVQPLVPKWNSFTAPRTSIGSLQPDLYRSSDSEGSSVAPTEYGRLWFSILYSREKSTLEVTLVRAKYLPGRGFCNGPRDPFVKLYLLPDEEHFQQSKVRRKTLSPKFNETFAFEVPETDVINRCLRLSVYDIDKRKVRHCLGHVVLALSKTDLETNTIVWKDLDKTPQLNLGIRLQVALMCNPFNNRIKVAISKAEKVEGIESGEAFVFLRVELFHGHKVMKSRKTSPKCAVGPKKTELIFREAMSFGVPARFYDSCYLQLTAFVSGGSLAPDLPIGTLVIGPFLFSRGEQLQHWQEMVANPRTFITRWHNMDRVNSSKYN